MSEDKPAPGPQSKVTPVALDAFQAATVPSSRTLSPGQRMDSDAPPSSTFDGEDFLFHLYRGSELLQDNCVSEAKEELERALSMQPRDVEGQGLLGVVYFRLGMYPRAIQIYEDLIRTFPGEVTPRINLALCYLKTGQPMQAREVLENVIRLVPSHRRAWGYLGLVFDRLGDHSKALAAFEHAEQPHMVRRMQGLLDEAAGDNQDLDDISGAEDELRQAAAEAVQEIDDEPSPFVRAETSPGSSPSRSGRWRAIELGQARLPPRAHPGQQPSLAGRFGPAVPPVPDSVFPASLRSPASAPILPPVELARELLVSVPAGQHTAQHGDRVVAARFADGFVARQDAIHAVTAAAGALTARRAARRARGRELDEPLGGLGAAFLLLEGQAELVLAAPDEWHLMAVELSSEFLYVREAHLVGFSGALRYENGRLARTEGDHIPMVQLSGKGSVVIRTRRPLRALEVDAEHPVFVLGDDVMGWTGRMLPSPLPPDEAPAGIRGFVRFTGDGAVFLDLLG